MNETLMKLAKGLIATPRDKELQKVFQDCLLDNGMTEVYNEWVKGHSFWWNIEKVFGLEEGTVAKVYCEWNSEEGTRPGTRLIPWVIAHTDIYQKASEAIKKGK